LPRRDRLDATSQAIQPKQETLLDLRRGHFVGQRCDVRVFAATELCKGVANPRKLVPA
jgi:hypothetical protein